MRLINIGLARSIWLFQIADWNPRGRSLNPIFYSLIDKYKFIQFPKLHEIDWQKGVKFEAGTFTNAGGEELAVNLTVYTDGVLADTRASTVDSDAFLDQALTFLSTDFNFPEYRGFLRKKIYASELYIKLEQSLNQLNPDLQQFSNRLSSFLSDAEISFECGISLSSDPSPGKTPLTFKLERAFGFPFAENRYYSAAPLETEAHLRLLEEFEATFLT